MDKSHDFHKDKIILVMQIRIQDLLVKFGLGKYYAFVNICISLYFCGFRILISERDSFQS